LIRGISDRSTIARLWSQGRTVRSADLRVRYLDAQRGVSPQVAYAISRKVGTAVVRNRIRRRLKAALYELRDEAESAFGPAMIIVYPSAAQRSYGELCQQLVEIMKKIEKSRENRS